MTRSILTLNDLTSEDLFAILERAKAFKSAVKEKRSLHILEGSVIGILFEKPSTRTRTSFESAILRLGGGAIYLSSDDLQIKRGEPIEDTARILGSYLDAVIVRVYSHQTLEVLSNYSGIPVINGLSDLSHPTQAICDLFTIMEVKGTLKGLTLAYIGDGNNVCHSLLLACALAGMNIHVASPKGFFPKREVVEKALEIAAKAGTRIHVVEDPKEGVKGADILYTDVWVSMGVEEEKETKLKAFQGYQINRALLKAAAPNAVVMHCLPAYRGLEITEEVMEGPQSIIWRQGENKMHGAAGILDFLLS
jgi:ornithine carbamoyltransferase